MQPRRQLAEDAPAHEGRCLTLVQQPSDDFLPGAGQGEVTRLAVAADQAGDSRDDVSIVGTVGPLKEVGSSALLARRHPTDDISRRDPALAEPALAEPALAEPSLGELFVGDVGQLDHGNHSALHFSSKNAMRRLRSPEVLLAVTAFAAVTRAALLLSVSPGVTAVS